LNRYSYFISRNTELDLDGSVDTKKCMRCDTDIL